MPAGENIDSNNGFGEQNPWQKMASEMPPFGENNKAEVTSDEDSEYLFFAPISKDNKELTFRRYVTEYDITHENINTKKINKVLERLIGAN